MITPNYTRLISFLQEKLIFITYNNKKNEVLEVLNNIKVNIEEVVTNPLLAKERIETLGDQTEQKARIGIASGAAFNVLKDNNALDIKAPTHIHNTI